MNSFDERKRAFEEKFAHDSTLRFKVEARRNRALGLWAAERLGRADADAYADEVMAADLEEAGDADVIRKVKADFAAAKVALTDEELQAKMREFLEQAKASLAEPS